MSGSVSYGDHLLTASMFRVEQVSQKIARTQMQIETQQDVLPASHLEGDNHPSNNRRNFLITSARRNDIRNVSCNNAVPRRPD